VQMLYAQQAGEGGAGAPPEPGPSAGPAAGAERPSSGLWTPGSD